MKKIRETNEYGQNISVKNANLWYGDFHAIKDMSVEIPEKQVTAFIGPSGCGKSTFLKCFNRMNDLVEGCRITGEFLVGKTDIYGKIDVNEVASVFGGGGHVLASGCMICGFYEDVKDKIIKAVSDALSGL